MNNCQTCQVDTTNPRFCSRSCAATFNNTVAPKRSWSCRRCGKTGNRPSIRARYCNECRYNSNKENGLVCLWKHCSTRLVGKQKKFCSRNCNCKHNTGIRRRDMKKRAVEYKGGECELCGYSRCLRTLSFHHCDPEHKDFSISSKSNHSWETIRRELDKCMLLCSNCHSEIHDGLVHPDSNRDRRRIRSTS